MTRRFVVEADGGSRGNPGPAGYGALVRDAGTGSVLARRNGFLGTTTNNVAEYTGLIEGLKAARALDPTATIDVRMDSKLVVEQVSGRWRVKHEGLKSLAREAVSLTSTFPSVRLTWVPRAQNADADALANEAMDARASTHDALTDDALADGAGSGDDGPDPAPGPRSVAPTWGAVPDTATRLLLLRHGQTALSVDRRFSGRGNPPLTDAGRRQAGQAAAHLAGRGLDVIVSSPLARAQETAAAVADRVGVPVATDEGWVELDFGSWEGLTFEEVRVRDPEGLKAWLAFEGGPAPHGGETFAACVARVTSARDALVAAYPGKSVLVVSHVTPIKTMAGLVLGSPPAAMAVMHLDLCSLSEVLAYGDGTGQVRGWNETSYLTG